MSLQVINNYLYLMDISSLSAFEDISLNIDPKRVNVNIKKAQDMDLSLFFGDAFWYDFINQFDKTLLGSTAISNTTTSAANGTYTNQAIVATSGVGAGATITLTVLNGAVTSVVKVSAGTGYAVGDTFTCAAAPGAQFTVSSVTSDFKGGTAQLYKDLFNGCVYNDLQGHPVYYQGIIPALAYWTFARFIEVDQIRYTATGPAQKRHEASEPATPKQIAQLVEMQRSMANAFANKIEKFLYVHKSNFPLWRASERNKNSRQPGARIRGIDRTQFNGRGYGYGNRLNELGDFI